MPSIDERVVSMAFENQAFETRVATTMSTLSKLDTALKNMGGTSGLDKLEAQANKVTLNAPMSALDRLKGKLSGAGQGAATGLGDIERAGSRVTLDGPNRAVDHLQQKMGMLSAGKTFANIENESHQVELSGINKAIDSVANKFGVLQGAASVAMGNIAAQAAMKGAAFGKSFAFGPITDGFKEYGTNLGSIQTILANTEGQQISGLDEVNKHLDELNTYSDQTIYNFSEMATNIGRFTAAGVDMDKSTSSIKGIANLAALSGSNSMQASTAMQQLSQAISSGKVGLQDWKSVENAQMGGAVFQKSLMRTAEAMGTVEKSAIKVDKATGKAKINGMSFRDSIASKPGQTSWLTSEVLVETLGQLTGDMTDAQLAAKGFSDEQVKAIQAQAKTAKAAATQVKTLPQVFDVARETIGSGWAKTFQLIFGDFEQAKKTFTELSNFINGFINKTSDARNKLFEQFNALGGRISIIAAIKSAFWALQDAIKPVIEAFRNIFPPATAKGMIDTINGFNALADSIRGFFVANGDKLERIFSGIFAVMHIGWTVVKELVGVVFDLFGAMGKGSGGFLGFVAGIGDFLVGMDEALTKGGLLKTFFEGLGGVLAVPVKLIGKAASAIKGLFQPSGGGQTRGAFADELREFGRALTPVERLVNRVKDGWQRLVDAFESAKQALEPWFSSFVGKLQNLGQLIGDALGQLKFDDVMKGVQTGLLAGLFVLVKKMFGKGGGFLDELSKTLGGVNKLIGGFTGQMEAMQSKLKAQTLLLIAGAVVVLAGGIFILSTIDGDKLATAMSAVAIGLGELMGAMKLMTTGMGKLGVLQLPVIAAGMIGLAFAVVLLSGAMKIFSTMDWEDIGKGLVGIAGSIAAVALSIRLMPPNLPATAAGLILVGIALNLIAGAVKIFASMKWEDMGKGLFGMSEVLGLIALAMTMMPPNMLATAGAILVLSFALVALTAAVRSMGSMDIATLLKGLGGVTAALVLLGLAMVPWFILAPSLIPAAAGLLIVSGALIMLGTALQIIGNMGVWGIIKGLAALAGAMVILAVGMYLMIGTLPGAVALMAAAAALAVLAPVLGFLGSLDISTIAKGLGAIALTLGVVAVMGLLAAPAMAALGIALIPLGLGFVVVALAAKIFAGAMSTLGTTGKAGITVFLTALTGFIALLPTIVIQFIKGLVSIVQEVTKLAPQVIAALGQILEMVISFVIDNAAKLATAIGLLVDAIIVVLVENVPKMQEAGNKLLLSLLTGISQNIGQVTTKVAEILTKFMDALTLNLPQLIEAGSRLLRNFLQGISSKFGEIATTVGNMIISFTTAIGSQAGRIASAAGTMMGKFVTALGTYSSRLVTAGANAVMNLMAGLGKKGPEIIKKGVEVARKLLNGIADGLTGLARAGFEAIIKFLNGLEQAIRDNSTRLIDAGIGVGDAILDGVKDAFGRGGGLLRKALETVFGALPGWAKKILKIKSPSQVFHEIGTNTMAGFNKGVTDSWFLSKKTIEKTGKDATKTAESSFGFQPKLLEGIVDQNPVISPVLDLSRVKGEVGRLRALTDVSPIKASASAGQARAITTERKAVRRSTAAEQAASEKPSLHFQQNNYSPEPLPAVEIYRRTNSLIGLSRYRVA